MSEQEEAKTSTEVETELDDQSRREFIGKLVTTAGAAALAGLVAGAAGADVYKGPTDIQKIPGVRSLDGGTAVDKDYYMTVDKHPPMNIQATKIKGPEGFRVTIAGQQVGEVLQQAGLLRYGVNLENAKITIEFSA